MGEIFAWAKPRNALEFTGERWTSAASGQIELEHLHRYLAARDLCRGRDVLDIACGEGYGAALLAQVARRVVGIDVAPDALAHATGEYAARNLHFTVGDARRIPLATGSIDVAVSFETLEHFAEQQQFLAELRRVLRPDGVLVLSTPDSDVYSPIGGPANPYHVRELSRDEFVAALSEHFQHVAVLGQRPLVGSAIVPRAPAPGLPEPVTYERRDEAHFECSAGLPRAVYLIACASNRPPAQTLGPSLYIHTGHAEGFMEVARAELQHARESLHAAEAELCQLREARLRERSEWEARLGAARQSARQTEAARAETEQQLAETAAALEAISSSTSWRLMEPARRTARRFPRLARLGRSGATLVQRVPSLPSGGGPALSARTDGALIARAFRYRRQFGWAAAGHRVVEWWRSRQGRDARAVPLPPPQGPVAPTDSERIKQRTRKQMDEDLNKFIASDNRLTLPYYAEPEISILIVLYNQAALTFACLRSLVETVGVSFEVVIVDNASSDATGQLLDRVEGAHIIRNAQNVHFLRGTNQAAAAARGRALLLLNNDTVVMPEALRAACETLYGDDAIGAVGGKLILPDGTLQEAGSVVWNDGSCAGYACGEMPSAPEVQFRREVDYCSGAFLLVRRELFEQLNGFDTRFAPAYYEETDLCLRLREIGRRVVYDPRAEIRHFEFGSGAGKSQAVALMQRNQAQFRERHARVLREQFPPRTPLLFARNPSRARRILVIDDRVPFPSQGAGFPRAAHILKRLHAAGFLVTHYPLTEPAADWRQVRAEHPLEIEFMVGYGTARFGEFLEARAGFYDLILVSRPHNMERFSEERIKHPGSYRNVGIIYDAEAVFALREARRLELTGRPLPSDEIDRRVAAEIALATSADAVVTVAEAEAELFQAAGISNVHVVGHALAAEQTRAAFDDRPNFLLVGALQSDDAPNVDALVWFVREIMPKLDALIGPGYSVRVAGELKAPCLKSLHHPRIDLLGRLDDLTGEYERARVFVAPTRFSSGIPFKLHEAAARGVPIVTTSLLASQLGWSDAAELLTGDTAEQFAAQAARLFADKALWNRLRQAAVDRVRRDCSLREYDEKLAAVIDSVERRTHARAPVRQSA